MHGLRADADAPPANLALLDLLYEVPLLLNIDDLKSLSATSRSFRERFAAQVWVVAVTCKEDFALVIKHRWPLLSMVILQTDCPRWFASPPSQRRLTSVDLYAEANSQNAFVCMLKSVHTVASAAAQQLADQMTAKWPDLTSFALNDVKLPAFPMAITAQLSKGNWSSLQSLTLPQCQLGAEGVLLLSQGDWPELMDLDVSSNGIDSEGMAVLIKVDWPVLTQIRLSFNPTLDAMAGAHLFKANWSLSSLGLSHIPINAAMAAELAQLHLCNLSAIYLITLG